MGFHCRIILHNCKLKHSSESGNATHLLTKSCNFWMGSGSPSLPHVSTSLLS